MRTLRFYFDYISSNAYFAWERLPALCENYNVTLEPVPVLFAALLEANGQLGPAEIRPKARWMWRNNLRTAALLGVPLKPPRHHPFSPLLPLRISSLELPATKRAGLIGELFRATWAHQLHVSEPDVVAGAAERVGLPGRELVDRAGQPEVKVKLRAQTDRAIEQGVFGVPTMIVDDELFWGFDDLGYLEMFLAGQDPLPADQAGPMGIGAPNPSAMRRQFRAELPRSWQIEAEQRERESTEE